MEKDRLIEIIEDISPSALAESWDNCGFQVDCLRAGQEVKTVLVSLEVTDAVIEEAQKAEADLILTHHPLIFGGIHHVRRQDLVGGYLIRLIQAGISVYSCHTSFDKTAGGNNDYLGALLELKNIRPFAEDNGFCRKGQTPFDVTFAEVIHKTADALNIEEKYFKWVGDLSRPIETIGWCTGSGSEFLQEAYGQCDLFITGDLKYHDAQAAKEKGLCVLDAGHYGSEKIFAENMAGLLYDRCGETVRILQSRCDLNPFD